MVVSSGLSEGEGDGVSCKDYRGSKFAARLELLLSYCFRHQPLFHNATT